MLETIAQNSVENEIRTLAAADPTQFAAVFRQYRTVYSKEVTRACLLHLAERGLDDVGKKMILWLSKSSDYLYFLLDPKLFSLQSARRLAAILYKADPQCLPKLITLTSQSDNVATRRYLSRALELIDFLGDKDALVPWLRQLTNSADIRLSSQAVKVLCEMRPNREMIKRQLQSSDDRIRANALEAVWHVGAIQMEDIFRSSLSDKSHRVVANALVGLYLLGDKTSFDQITKFVEHPEPMFRRAIVWTLGYIADPRGIAILKKLSLEDESLAVRKKAAKTLESFPSDPADLTFSQDSLPAGSITPSSLE